jgi:hypothetical protein
MKTTTKKTTLKSQAALRDKVSPSGFKNNADFEKGAGLFEGMEISLKTLREKTWKRN